MDGRHDAPRDGRAILDLRGLKCPLPVLRTRKALLGLTPGRLIEVLCTDPLAGLDIPNLARETGDTLLETVRDGRDTRFLLRKSWRRGLRLQGGSIAPSGRCPRQQ